jgi:F0F1-type ATP synthase assembly protein I
MSAALIKPVVSIIYRIAFYQLVILMGLAAALSMVKNLQSGASAFAGGMAYWLPGFIFIRGVSGLAYKRLAFIVSFLGGEVIKLILSGLLFLLAVQYGHANLFYAVVGLLAAIGSFWLVSLSILYKAGMER